MPYGLSEETTESIRKTFDEFDTVEKVILYGSRAMGTYRAGSDIDLTLQGRGLSLSVLNKVKNALDDLLMPYQFDLSLYEDIQNEDLIDHIKRVGVVFYEVK